MANYGGTDKTFFDSSHALYDYFAQLAVGSDRRLCLLVDPVENDPHQLSCARQVAPLLA